MENVFAYVFRNGSITLGVLDLPIPQQVVSETGQRLGMIGGVNRSWKLGSRI